LVVAVVEGVVLGAVRDECGVVVVDGVETEGGVVVGAMVSGARWSPGANPPMSAVVDDPDNWLVVDDPDSCLRCPPLPCEHPASATTATAASGRR
jgi:hypothetical protein